MENKNEPTIYKGFEITSVFNYTSGRSDFEVFPPDSEYGYMAPYKTLDQVKSEIDEKLSEA